MTFKMLRLGLAGGSPSSTLGLSCVPCTTLQVLPRKNCQIHVDYGSRRCFGRRMHNFVVATAAVAAGAGDGYMRPSPTIENGPVVGTLMTTTRTRTTPSYNALAAVSVTAPALVEEKLLETLNIKDADKDTSPNVVLPKLVASVADTSGNGPAGVDPNYTVLQKHVAYFDRNQDGVIYPTETFEGFRALGYPIITSILGSFLINAALSYPTYDGWIPDPRLPIYVESIHLTKHGSDTDVYDKDGNFVQQRFDEIFRKFATTHPDKMSYDELLHMTNSLQDVHDFFGWNAGNFEWILTHQLAKDSEGFASKDAIRGVYDGSFFTYIENQLKKEATSK